MIRRVVVQTLATPPILTVLRRRGLSRGAASILCYHTLGPDIDGTDGWTVRRESDFRSDLTYLKQHYNIVSLDTILHDDDAARSDKPQVVLTFDDGDRGLARYLGPILAETGTPVTIYVATSQIETGQPFWFDRVVNALQQGGDINIAGLGHWNLPRTPGKERWSVLRDILASLKAAPPEERDALADRIAAAGAPPLSPALGPMTRKELAELAGLPGLTIGAHSHGHELLDQISLEAAQSSIQRSRDLLRDWTGQVVHHFAFPNGNYTEELQRMVADLGFASATILGERLVPFEADPFALPRLSIGRYDSPTRVRLKLVGL